MKTINNFNYREHSNDIHAYGEVNSNIYEIDGEFKPEDYVVDIGAHIGSFSRFMYDRYKCKTILSYEPNVDNFSVLSKNIENTSIKGFNVGVYSETTTLKFSKSFKVNGWEEITSHHSIFLSGPKEEEVPVIAFDTVFDHIPPATDIRLLKLDCEGAEYPILYTSKNLNRIQEIVMEYHEFDSSEFSASGKELAKFLEQNGFSIKKFQELGNLNLVGNVGYIKAIRK